MASRTVGPLNDRRTVEIPEALLLEVLPLVRDMAELQMTVAVARMALERGGLGEPVAIEELLRDTTVRAAFREEGTTRDTSSEIERGVELAVGRGTLIKIRAIDGEAECVWYYVNTITNAATVSAIATGKQEPPRALWTESRPPSVERERPTVFRLYEQNIAPLTPLIAQRLLDALEVYPQGWIEDAIAEAVSYNRRSWRYINRILENWQVERWATADTKGQSR